MIVVSGSHNLPQLTPLDSPHFRPIKEYDEQLVLDNLASHLAYEGLRPGPIKPPDRVKYINDKVVNYLYGELIHLVATLRFDELLNRLISYSEATIARLF
jgi:hypothetical protein